MTWFNYHHLLYFYEIVREGTVAKAASKLRIGQPALSMQIKNFEEYLNLKLFDRSNRSLQLTESGQVAFKFADEIFKLGDEMIMTLKNQHSAAGTEVVIGVIDSVPKHLAVRLCEFAQTVDPCILSIHEGSGDMLVRELKAHRIDLLISNYAPALSHGLGLYGRCVAKMPVVIAAAEQYAHLIDNFPFSLRDQPLILPTIHSRLRFDLEHYFTLNQIRPKMVIEAQDTSMMKLFAKHGSGLIPATMPAIDEMVADRELVVIGQLDDVFEELWLVASDRKIKNKIVSMLMKEFRID